MTGRSLDEDGVEERSEERSQSNTDKEAKARLILSQVDHWRFFSDNPQRAFPTFDSREIEIGRELGEGAFCSVSEIQSFALGPAGSLRPLGQKQEENVTGDENERRVPLDIEALELKEDQWDKEQEDREEHLEFSSSEARNFMSDHCMRAGTARYAVKRIKSDHDSDEKISAMLDLAVEMKFLRTLRHPNIIKMRGFASGDPLRPDYFIVLDRLYGTLDERIDMWRETYRNNSGCLPCMGGDSFVLKILLIERVVVAYDIASAFRYLHRHNLIYRDIKTENIGFDVRNDVKLFDFGLAKELCESEKTKEGLYEMTGLIGSRRYMAPEVIQCKPYNLSADSYSYGVLLWQIMAMDTPFEYFTPEMQDIMVVRDGFRPPIPKSWPASIKTLIKECWSQSIDERPKFQRIVPLLKTYLNAQEEADNIMDNRSQRLLDRSINSMRGLTN